MDASWRYSSMSVLGPSELRPPAWLPDTVAWIQGGSERVTQQLAPHSRPFEQMSGSWCWQRGHFPAFAPGASAIEERDLQMGYGAVMSPCIHLPHHSMMVC